MKTTFHIETFVQKEKAEARLNELATNKDAIIHGVSIAPDRQGWAIGIVWEEVLDERPDT